METTAVYTKIGYESKTRFKSVALINLWNELPLAEKKKHGIAMNREHFQDKKGSVFSKTIKRNQEVLL